ncbi:hypothetical protein NDU88_003396 [Pleurodeles waltl]|uniref:Uncharacterized protein n=1 Tax=Pleurodeles waltl TaxID=8319 RepID=A0AAV7T4J1_PLEWA|nr:hypothetical protein NDU88_003396 [Pleurodeles waltl]
MAWRGTGDAESGGNAEEPGKTHPAEDCCGDCATPHGHTMVPLCRKAWAWLERYTSDMTWSPKRKEKEKNMATTAQRRKRRRRSRCRALRKRLTKPSPTQSEEGKKLALQAAASLTEPDFLDGMGAGTNQDHDSDPRLSDSDLQASAPEDLPRVTTQTSDNII